MRIRDWSSDVCSSDLPPHGRPTRTSLRRRRLRIPMPDSRTADTLTNSPIEAAFRERTPGSAELATEAKTRFPSGITHDARHLKPYGVYVERASGPRKWDVDGNEYVDYFGGHGA